MNTSRDARRGGRRRENSRRQTQEGRERQSGKPEASTKSTPGSVWDYAGRRRPAPNSSTGETAINEGNQVDAAIELPRTIAKYIERFRKQPPKSPSERGKMKREEEEFWWKQKPASDREKQVENLATAKAAKPTESIGDSATGPSVHGGERELDAVEMSPGFHSQENSEHIQKLVSDESLALELHDVYDLNRRADEILAKHGSAREKIEHGPAKRLLASDLEISRLECEEFAPSRRLSDKDYLGDSWLSDYTDLSSSTALAGLKVLESSACCAGCGENDSVDRAKVAESILAEVESSDLRVETQGECGTTLDKGAEENMAPGSGHKANSKIVEQDQFANSSSSGTNHVHVQDQLANSSSSGTNHVHVYVHLDGTSIKSLVANTNPPSPHHANAGVSMRSAAQAEEVDTQTESIVSRDIFMQTDPDVSRESQATSPTNSDQLKEIENSGFPGKLDDESLAEEDSNATTCTYANSRDNEETKKRMEEKHLFKGDTIASSPRDTCGNRKDDDAKIAVDSSNAESEYQAGDAFEASISVPLESSRDQDGDKDDPVCLALASKIEQLTSELQAIDEERRRLHIRIEQELTMISY